MALFEYPTTRFVPERGAAPEGHAVEVMRLYDPPIIRAMCACGWRAETSAYAVYAAEFTGEEALTGMVEKHWEKVAMATLGRTITVHLAVRPRAWAWNPILERWVRDACAEAGWELRNRYGDEAPGSEVKLLWRMVASSVTRAMAEGKLAVAQLNDTTQFAQGYDEPLSEAAEHAVIGAVWGLIETLNEMTGVVREDAATETATVTTDDGKGYVEYHFEGMRPLVTYSFSPGPIRYTL
jgi:hypothetical protein